MKLNVSKEWFDSRISAEEGQEIGAGCPHGIFKTERPKIEFNNIYCGDNVELTKELVNDCIDLTITSPPYSDLREYKGYSWDFEGIAKELFRVTKPGGVVVWVVGDKTDDGDESGVSFREALFFKNIGFKLHDTMIYQKSNFSNPSKNRYHQVFEYMFVFSKGKPKTFNPIMDKENAMAGKTIFGANTVRQPDGSFKERKTKVYNQFGMRGNVWKLKTAGQENPCKKQSHPAAFPLALVNDHIISWSNPGDVVFDPFMGGGTTAIAAIKNDRKFLGFEISREYVDLASKRIQES